MTAADLPAITVDDVERTARDATRAQWTVAGIGMLGSALAAYFAIDHLGETGWVGVVTAATADLALIWWLRIAKRLRATGQRSLGGIVLEIATAAVMLYQNLGAAVFTGIDKQSEAAHWLLGIEHVFIPVLLVISFVAFDDATFKLGRLARQVKAAETAELHAQAAADQAAADAAAEAAEAAEMRRERDTTRTENIRLTQDLGRLRGELEQQTAATQTVREQLAQALEAHDRTPAQQPARTQTAPAGKPRRTPPADRETRRQWVRAERAAGRAPTGADVDKRFGAPRNGAAVVKEVLAEEKNRLHVVGGKR